MELIEVLLVLGIFFPLLCVGIWQLNRVNLTKRGLKAGDSSIKEMYSVYNQQVTDVLKVKDKQISSLSTKLRNFEEEEEEIDEKEVKPMQLEGLKPILASRGLNPALLDLPFVQGLIKKYTKVIKKYTKDLSVDEISQLIGLFAGGKQPQQSNQDATLPAQNANYF